NKSSNGNSVLSAHLWANLAIMPAADFTNRSAAVWSSGLTPSPFSRLTCRRALGGQDTFLVFCQGELVHGFLQIQLFRPAPNRQSNKEPERTPIPTSKEKL